MLWRLKCILGFATLIKEIVVPRYEMWKVRQPKKNAKNAEGKALDGMEEDAAYTKEDAA